ncbi:cyclase family protein [Candidatus Bipolaricaulota bacterium]|nr:cyclase family protein [Candidatus Bipolaricaulota bacterium]
MYVQFSYPLDAKNVLMPGGIAGPVLRPRSRMTPAPADNEFEGVRWESYNNTSFIDAFVHTGTHVDTAFHVSKERPNLGDFSIADFVFEQPLLIQVAKTDQELIKVSDLESHAAKLQESDLLLIYTGFSRYRESDPERYTMRQPGFSPEAAEYLVSLPKMRCVGADIMGIENIPEGRKADPPFPAHRKFLLSGKKFLILEDPNIAPLVGKALKRAFIVPLLFPEAEAMMVTAFAEAI